MTSYKEKLTAVTTFMFDVDGVLSNGKVFLYKDEVVRCLSSRDGYALQYASKMGYNIFIVTGGHSQPVKDRLLSLGCTEVCLGSKNKLEVYNDLKTRYDFTDAQVVFMGDDIPDYDVMLVAGVAACPQDAAVEIKHISDYQSPYNGGDRCVRDIIEQTLRVQDKWFKDGAMDW